MDYFKDLVRNCMRMNKIINEQLYNQNRVESDYFVRKCKEEKNKLIKEMKKRAKTVRHWVQIAFHAIDKDDLTLAKEMIKKINGDNFNNWKGSYESCSDYYHLFLNWFLEEMERTAISHTDQMILWLNSKKGSDLEKESLCRILDISPIRIEYN